MNMPGHALRSDFRMSTQVVQGISVGNRVVLLVRKGGCFARSRLLHPQPAIDDREDVMRREIVWVNGLHRLIFGARLVVFLFLIQREAELAMSIAGARKLRDHRA